MPTAGLVKAAGERPNVPLNERTKLQLQFLVLQCKLQVGTIDEDVVDITSSLSLQLPELEAVTQHQIVLRTQAARHDLEENGVPLDCFAETVEALFEASDVDSEEFAAALADRKTDLLRFCNALADLAGTDTSEQSLAHSLVVGQLSYSYPKADALAALSEVVEALRAYLRPLDPACNTVPPQADAAGSPVAGCEHANTEEEQPVMGGDGPAGRPQNTVAQSTGSPAPGLEAIAAGDMQQLSMKQSCANSDVDILNTPTSQSQEALVTRLGMPSRAPWNEPDPNSVNHGNDHAPGEEAIPQPGDGGIVLQPADLTESQLLVPDSYPSDRPADEAHPELIGDGPGEQQPEALSEDVVHAETQYQDVLQDEEMPQQELSEWQVADQEAEEEVRMEEDGMGTENQENCSLHSNSQAPAAHSQGKKGQESQEDNIRGSDSPERPQHLALHGMPDETQGEYQQLDMDEGLEAARAGAEAHEAGDFAGISASLEAHEDPPADAEALHASEAEVVPDAEEDFQDAQARPSTDAESDEGSSESDYDSPSWQGSGESLLYGSEQQDMAAKSLSESQEPVLHLSLGIDSSQPSQGGLQSRADMRAREAAQPRESQEAFHEAPLRPDRDSGSTAATGTAGKGEEATDDPAGVPGSMARMTVVTKPDALAQPRRHKAKRRTMTSPKKVVRAAELDQRAAADDHQGNGEAAEADRASADERAAVGGAGSPLMDDVAEQPSRAPETHSRAAAAATTVTPDEVVRSFLRLRDGAPVAPASPRGLTELMGVIQAELFPGTAAAAAPAAQGAVASDASAAAVHSPNGSGHARRSAPAAAAASSVQVARSGSARGEDGHGDKEDVTGDRQTPAAEPAWRMKKCSAVARRDMALDNRGASMPKVPINVSTPHQDSAQQSSAEQRQRGLQALPQRQVPSASAAAAAARTVDGPGEDNWHSLIAGLSFSTALESQPSAARAAARQPPPLREAAAHSTRARQMEEASLPAPTSPSRRDQARRPAHAPPQQADRGRGSRMAELQFHAPNHGSRTTAPQETGTPSAGRSTNGDLPGRRHQLAQQQRQEVTRNADTTGPEVPVPSTTAAAPVDSRTQPAPKRLRQQNSGIPSEAPPPPAKRQRVHGAVGGGSGGSLWDLANNVMVHMAQRLMPGAPAEQSAPPQAPASEAHVPSDQQAASAPSVPSLHTATGTSGRVEQPEDHSCNPTPPPLQTAALRAVVEAAITNPGAVALPTLVPARYQRAHQKAAAAVRAASARANAQRAATSPVEVPLVQMEAAPSSIGQNHLPARMAHRPAPASVPSMPDTGRRAEPTAFQRHVEDDELPSISQELTAGMQHGAAQLPEALAAGPQQPLTQLPSSGYNDAAVAEWPEQAPVLQPQMPPLEERGLLSAQPQCLPTPRHAAVSGTAWRSTPAAVGLSPAGWRSAEVLSEQRQWPQASRRGTGRGYLGRDGPPAFAAAGEWGCREQGMQYDVEHVQAGAAALQAGQSLRSTMSAASISQAHNPVQQGSSLQRPEMQQRGYTPKQSGLAPAPGPGVSSSARSPWELAQLAAASGREQQQPLDAQPFPARVQGFQQEMSPLAQAPHTYARQRPTHPMGTGHPSLPEGGLPGMAVCGDLAQQHPAAITGTGYSSLGTGRDPTTGLYGRSLRAQQQPMWQHALQMQEGQVQAPTAWEPTPIGTDTACPPLAAYSGHPPQQQPWHYQQMSRPGSAPQQHRAQEFVQYDMARHVSPVQPSVQQAPFPSPLQLYSPRHGACEWPGGPLA
ncbi:hypothetical protein COCOBI_11-0890 [Coccomyxa sp. Obi]|nr:hypothetical protein COCOBI_11-0890 [Coccomyxa sp. Obi]